MPLNPYKLRPVPPEVAILLDEQTILDERGLERPIATLRPGETLYADGELIDDLIAEGIGEALCWRGQALRWRWVTDGAPWNAKVPTAQAIRVGFPDDPLEAVAGFRSWRDWLAGHGASPLGSLGSSSRSLLRATLEGPLWTNLGDVPRFVFPLGARQEDAWMDGLAHIVEGPLRLYDMPAAYAETLGGLRYGGDWRRVDHRVYPFERTHERGELVFVRARVRLPELRYGALPRRPRRSPSATGLREALEPVFYPRAGVLQGVWTWDELLVCLEHGGRILRTLDVWVHSRDPKHDYPFAPWWEAVQLGRAMPGFAGALAKATGNALWGQFVIRSDGRREIVQWRRDAGGTVRRVARDVPVPGRMPPAYDLSEQLTGKVRARLARFMVGAGDALVSVHTDGGWVTSARDWRPAGFRQRARARRLDFLGPQFYRIEHLDGALEHVVSGTPRRLAAETFDREWSRKVDLGEVA